jgi:hypothetical protein
MKNCKMNLSRYHQIAAGINLQTRMQMQVIILQDLMIHFKVLHLKRKKDHFFRPPYKSYNTLLCQF